MSLIKMVVGGLAGGLIGAAIWAAIGYFTGYEVGWIAWGIGFLAGLGVSVTGSQEVARFDKVQRKMVVERTAADGPLAGAVAAIAAVLSVLVGKYAVIHLLVASPSSLEEYLDDETMIASIADEIVFEQEAQGRNVEWPEGVDPEEAYLKDDYPPAIWSEAEGRWNALSPGEREARKSLQADAIGAAMSSAPGARGAVFLASFGLFDVLWFGLAAVTAFKIGASSGSSS
jgi:hypothetical protein